MSYININPTVFKQNDIVSMIWIVTPSLPNTTINIVMLSTPENNDPDSNIFPTEVLTNENGTASFSAKLSGTGTYKFNVSGNGIASFDYYLLLTDTNRSNIDV